MILQGQRQVGRSYFIKNEAIHALDKEAKIHCLDFIKDPSACIIFESYKSVFEVIERIELYLDTKINIEKDLLFLDEIQDCSKAIQSLKYFCEDLSQLRIVAAGSYLGKIANQDSFPVGKVDFKNLGILSFEEFLKLYSPSLSHFYALIDIDSPDPVTLLHHQELLKVFQLYLAIGGMPAVVFSFLENYKENKNYALQRAREIQKNILLSYQADFSKYAGVVNATHILNVYVNAAAQLSKSYDEEVARFKFSGVLSGTSNFQKISGPLTWLEQTRLLIKVNIASKAQIPLKAYTKENIFKLYYSDVGLLQASLDIPISKSYSLNLGEYKGYIVENFIASQLFIKSFSSLFSWSEGESEVEFLIYRNDEITPVEVKSSANFSRAKSLKTFVARYSPKESYKLGPLNKGKNKDLGITTLPIYLINKL
jgi:predicted AAA+ superfamily ATPase